MRAHIALLLPSLVLADFGSAAAQSRPFRPPEGAGAERLPVAVKLSEKHQYTRSSILDADLTGTDRSKIGAMAVVLQTPIAGSERLRPDELAGNPNIVWQPLQDAVQIDLGPGDDVRSVWFGFRDGSGRERWIRRRVCVDTTPPDLQIKEPSSTVVSDPLLHLKATSSDDLLRVTYQLKNSRGILAKQVAAINKRVPDQVTGRVALTFFECRGVELAPGRNDITFELEDVAGNVSEATVVYTLDPSVDTTPPEIIVHWPTASDQVFGRTCRIRGRTSERSVHVEARRSDGTVFPGIAELDGHFWIYDVPLTVGWNLVTVSATDAAGNQSTQDLRIERHPVEIQIDPPTEKEKATRRPTITGTVSDPEYIVWVNGTKAEMHGTRWVARSVLLNSETGTAIVQAVAIHRSVADSLPGWPQRPPRLEDMGNPKAPTGTHH